MIQYNLNEFLGIENKGDKCNKRYSCGYYSPDNKINHCDPIKCLEATLRAINSTVGDN